MTGPLSILSTHHPSPFNIASPSAFLSSLLDPVAQQSLVALFSQLQANFANLQTCVDDQARTIRRHGKEIDQSSALIDNICTMKREEDMTSMAEIYDGSTELRHWLATINVISNCLWPDILGTSMIGISHRTCCGTSSESDPLAGCTDEEIEDVKNHQAE